MRKQKEHSEGGSGRDSPIPQNEGCRDQTGIAAKPSRWRRTRPVAGPLSRSNVEAQREGDIL